MNKPAPLLRPAALLALLALSAAPAAANDWPMWGGSASRNMVQRATGLPDDVVTGKLIPKTETIDPQSTKNVRWVTKLGSQTYGTPVVAGGRVFVGTNNESPRDAAQQGDRGVLMCFDEKTGAFLWQLVIPKVGAGKVSDWEFVGLCSSAAIEGDRGYVVSNRGELICFDVKGMADGNQGSFQDEAKFSSVDGKPAAAEAEKPKRAALKWGSGLKTLLIGGGASHDYTRWFNLADVQMLNATAKISANYLEPQDVTVDDVRPPTCCSSAPTRRSPMLACGRPSLPTPRRVRASSCCIPACGITGRTGRPSTRSSPAAALAATTATANSR